LRTALLAVFHALRIEYAADDVIANARKVLHAATTDHNDRVLLKVMPLARNIPDDLELVGQADLGNLTESRVRLLRRSRVDARANTALLRALLHSGHLARINRSGARLANELIDRRHAG